MKINLIWPDRLDRSKSNQTTSKNVNWLTNIQDNIFLKIILKR